MVYQRAGRPLQLVGWQEVLGPGVLAAFQPRVLHYQQTDGTGHQDVIMLAWTCRIGAIAFLIISHLVHRIHVTLDVLSITHRSQQFGDGLALGLDVGVETQLIALALVQLAI